MGSPSAEPWPVAPVEIGLGDFGGTDQGVFARDAGPEHELPGALLLHRNLQVLLGGILGAARRHQHALKIVEVLEDLLRCIDLVGIGQIAAG